MSDLREHLERSLEDQEFRQAWDDQAAEREVMRKIVQARTQAGMTQAELAQACGMKPANLCRLENGNGNPSVATLSRIAHGLGRELQISFV
jgi:DNA-binding XRE family transcriptional regulator